MAAKRGQGDTFGDWSVIDHFATGGNGQVYKVVRRSGGEDVFALKQLKKASSARLKRFASEIAALHSAADIDGIIPLVDLERPVSADTAPRWYVMPLARKMSEFLHGKEVSRIVSEFIPLAKTLAKLHARGIAHRDLKPANVLALDGRLCLSDFGLVSFPGKQQMTPSRGELGPKFTMAPEMRRDAKAAVGAPADVYSFAKTFWIALTGEAQGFDGQYSSISSVALGRYHPELFTEELDPLLSKCTDHEPDARPTMAEVADTLTRWVEVEKEFHKRNLAEWVGLQHKLFPSGMPSSAKWTDNDGIIAILDELSRIRALNHMFFPTGGGFDLQGVVKSHENGCIELHAGSPRIIRPQFLSFECFAPGSVWNYFWLQADELEASGVDESFVDNGGFAEHLCELEPGHYVGIDVWEYGSPDGEVLPTTARPIVRVLKGGFVVFAKRSWYNLTSQTYDGRHEKAGYERFRAEIAECAEKFPEPPPQ